MNLPNSIVALLLAFLVGSPLCCCATQNCGVPSPDDRPSCCGGAGSPEQDDPAPEPHACACRTKEPREMAKACGIPADQPVPLPAEVLPAVELAVVAPAPARVVQPFFPGCDPPRTRLSRLSRWLL